MTPTSPRETTSPAVNGCAPSDDNRTTLTIMLSWMSKNWRVYIETPMLFSEIPPNLSLKKCLHQDGNGRRGWWEWEMGVGVGEQSSLRCLPLISLKVDQA